MQAFPPCPSNWTNHLPCYDPKIAILYPRENNEFRERHCPGKSNRRRCLVPAPLGYRRPIPWPESRDWVWFRNVPHTTIADNKRNKNWMARKGDRWHFPGGGSMFPDGVEGYLYHLRQIVELGPNVRTALDIGSGVASFGAALLDYGVLTMSIAPKDSYRAQIQFALERGLPAMIGLLATHRLPFPARSFDLIHCSRCSASFGDENSTHVYEVDRLLRPNGVFILAGQPVAWRGKIAEWKRLRLLGKALCWELLKTVGNVAVWRKLGGDTCRVGVEGGGGNVPLCSPALDPDDAWYVKLQPCAVPSAPPSWPTPPWPLRLHTPSPRVQLALPASSKASLSDWLADTGPNTLPAIYDRGLVGTVHDWCESFSSYPRTYDLIHLLSTAPLMPSRERCEIADIVLEMDRLLRPGGTVIVRDQPGPLAVVAQAARAAQWSLAFFPPETKKSPERILVATKPVPAGFEGTDALGGDGEGDGEGEVEGVLRGW
ncbi:unnamed protein product [Closterium sp. Yama58-4]|nr:unnamed protein product [Closterium sp. Yama58-4]